MTAHRQAGRTGPPELLHAIIRQRGQTPERVVLLTPTFVLVGVHWSEGRKQTVPHLTRRCVPCETQSEVRLEGFAPAWCQVRNKAIVVALSRHACQDLMSLREAHGTLEGLEVQLLRERNASNGKLRVAFVAQHDVLRLPPGFDPRPTLCTVWGIPDVSLLSDRLVVGDEMPEVRPEGGPPVNHAALSALRVGNLLSGLAVLTRDMDESCNCQNAEGPNDVTCADIEALRTAPAGTIPEEDGKGEKLFDPDRLCQVCRARWHLSRAGACLMVVLASRACLAAREGGE